MTQSKRGIPMDVAISMHVRRAATKTRVREAYRRFFRNAQWYPKGRINEQREYLFKYVFLVRHQGEFGNTIFMFYGSDLQIYGPYCDLETCYAAWVLYMEAIHD